MTVKIQMPRKSLADRILKLLGRERKLVIPEDEVNAASRRYGPHVYMGIRLRWESFGSALVGSRSKQDNHSE